ncbi:MAG: hypothetical protein GY710_21465 [Desulfobacteraceae bacterium]|nr:hypothetical protein [Desulfobacteraceae bacterium]
MTKDTTEVDENFTTKDMPPHGFNWELCLKQHLKFKNNILNKCFAFLANIILTTVLVSIITFFLGVTLNA